MCLRITTIIKEYSEIIIKILKISLPLHCYKNGWFLWLWRCLRGHPPFTFFVWKIALIFSLWNWTARRTYGQLVRFRISVENAVGCFLEISLFIFYSSVHLFYCFLLSQRISLLKLFDWLVNRRKSIIIFVYLFPYPTWYCDSVFYWTNFFIDFFRISAIDNKVYFKQF